jgi:hypothetical protein
MSPSVAGPPTAARPDGSGAEVEEKLPAAQGTTPVSPGCDTGGKVWFSKRPLIFMLLLL